MKPPNPVACMQLETASMGAFDRYLQRINAGLAISGPGQRRERFVVSRKGSDLVVSCAVDHLPGIVPCDLREVQRVVAVSRLPVKPRDIGMAQRLDPFPDFGGCARGVVEVRVIVNVKATSFFLCAIRGEGLDLRGLERDELDVSDPGVVPGWIRREVSRPITMDAGPRGRLEKDLLVAEVGGLEEDLVDPSSRWSGHPGRPIRGVNALSALRRASTRLGSCPG